MRVSLLLVSILLVASIAAAKNDTPRLIVELEGAPVWQTRNDVRIPNNATATKFSLVDVIGRGPWPAGRAYLTWNVSDHHGIRLLAAPLSVTETGTLADTVRFSGGTFVPGSAEATYKFNSWRATYRYQFRDSNRWALWVGFTAKIRDAKIEVSQGGQTTKKTDLGFVPLLHLAGEYRVAGPVRLVFDADALAGGPGRAEDATVKLAYDVNDTWRLTGGYRTVEGGADVSSVYNFAWLHYAAFSVVGRF